MASQIESSTSVISPEEAALPVQLTIDYPERLSRLLLFFKWLFVIPVLFVAGFYGIGAGIASIIAFFAILFVGRYPRGLFDFVVGYYRFVLRMTAYYPYFLVDKWWPNDPHPLDYEAEYPEKLSRGILLLKLLSGCFEVVGTLCSLVSLVILLFTIPAWFIILFTGRYPRGMYNIAVMLYQWMARVVSWQSLLRDEWLLFGTTQRVQMLVWIGIVVSVIGIVVSVIWTLYHRFIDGATPMPFTPPF